MNEGRFLVLSAYGLISFFVGSVLFRKAAGGLGLKYANVLTWTYYYYIFMFLIASFSNAAGLYSDWMARQAMHTGSAETAFYVTFFSFMALPAIVLLLQSLLKIQPQLEGRNLFELPKQNVGENDDTGVLLILAIMAIILPLFFILMVTSLDIPIETLVKGGSWLEMAIARRQWVMTEVQWIQYARNILGRWVAPLSSLVSLGYFLKKRNLFTFALCVWLTVIAVLYLFSSLERAPLLYFCIAFFYVSAIFRGGISAKGLLTAAIIIIGFGSLLFYITLQPYEFLEVITKFVERVLFVQYSGTVLTFDFFPRYRHFLGFNGLCHGLLGRLLGCDSIRYSLLLMQTYNPTAWSAGRVGYMSTLYIAEGYACFGIPGIFFSVFVASIWLTGLQWLFFRVRLHPVSVGFLSLLMVRVLSFLGDGILAFIYPSEFIAPTFLVIMLILWERRRLAVVIKKPPPRLRGRRLSVVKGLSGDANAGSLLRSR